MFKLMKGLRPEFWDAEPEAGPNKSLFNYRRTWRKVVLFLAAASLAPLLFMGFLDYNVTRNSLDSEILLRTARTTSNTKRSVSAFVHERKSALKFVVKQESVISLRDPKRLATILQSLKESFGGFVDLGLIDNTGKQVAYIGPHKLLGRDYSGQEWLRKTHVKGAYTSDVFLGYRDEPHMIVAIKFPCSDKCNYVLRATLDTGQINSILSSLDLSGDGDLFLVNRKGQLQTPSRWHGKVFSKVNLPIPDFDEKTRVLRETSADNEDVTVGYAYIPDTPFILMVVKKNDVLMKPFEVVQLELFWILAVSMGIILLVILGVATYMVDKIYIADQTRAKTLHHMEHTNRMASIGRLAAGVAHEINNPLAIINEKAGLIKDIFHFKKEYSHDEMLLSKIDSIISSVERCGTITKRLLGFARHIDVHTEDIQFKGLAEEVIGFLHKEAEYRSINIRMAIPDNLPTFTSDRGKLQQIFLNLVNNAFQAMNDGGKLSIEAHPEGADKLSFTVRDDGCGIPEADRKRIFEPFFSTKKRTGGTGLGLSITYGLVQELGGTMSVESEVGVGTAFTIILPLHVNDKEATKQ